MVLKSLEGCLTLKKQTPPKDHHRALGMNEPTAKSFEEAVSHERGTPVELVRSPQIEHTGS